MANREFIEEREALILSPLAVLAKNSKGRIYPIEECSIRTAFQRDRDRIIHSKAFRRLKHKTQVFIAPEGDHYRTRLTHTLEVAQISGTIARALMLNEDLTHAMALGHDLGHTPFGHSGEECLDKLCSFGFKHYQQSLRVVDVLEGDKGLNLTFEVRDGILNHTGDNKPITQEGLILKLADRIAYINHDIDDAMRAGLLENIPKEFRKALGETHGRRINTLVNDIINHSEDGVKMSPEIAEAMMELRAFMFENVYSGEHMEKERNKAMNVIDGLFDYYMSNANELPEVPGDWSVERRVCDFIAGMSDQFAVSTFTRLFVPRPWSN